MTANSSIALYLSCSAWFLGGMTAFYSDTTLELTIGVLTVLVFSCLILFLSKSFQLKITQRKLILAGLFFLVGALNFQLNDFRNQEDHRQKEREGSFKVHVLEVGKTTGQSQNLLVQCIYREEKGLILQSDFKFLVHIQEPDSVYHVDDDLILDGVLSPIKQNKNPGAFDGKWYYLTKGVTHQLYAFSDQIVSYGNSWTLNGMFLNWRDYLAKQMEKYLDGDFLGVSKALLLGDKANLDQDVMSSFSNTGSMHVLAVSGLHVGLLLYILNFILARFSRFLSKKQSMIIAIIVIWCYGLLTGASPAVMRAVFMFSVIAFGGLLNRKSAGMISLFVTAIILSVFNPWVVFDVGFQLSFLAMLGIFLLYPKIDRLLIVDNKILKWAWEGTAVGLAATAFTTPLTLYYFYQFPNYFLISNIGVMLFGFLVLLLGMIFLFSSFIPGISVLSALLFSFTILGLLVWVKWVDEIPGSVSGGFHVSLTVLLISIIVVFLYSMDYKKWKLKIPLAVITGFMICYLSFDRSEYFDKRELIFLNGKELVVVFKTPGGCLAFYEPRYGHANKVPGSLEDFCRFSGQRTVVKDLNYGFKSKFGKDLLAITRVKYGWEVVCNKTKYFYQTYGVPVAKGNGVIFNSKLQALLNPEKEQRYYSFKI